MTTIPESEKRHWRPATTPTEVLSECLLDIRDGLWVCGELHKPNPLSHHVAKPMGCAIGLIGINSGNSKILFEDGNYFAIFGGGEEGGEACCSWNRLGQETAIILANALDELDEDEEYEKTDDPSAAEDRIVNHNDTYCQSPSDAREWFEKALQLASK